MPLRLKSLELHGYKTFAAKTDFEFSEGITAIVGPNGSGKSNIADALRWVLGEQSYSLLRAKKTEDMIFAGSEQRPRSGMASVGITFDNSNNWLPVDFSEVALARRAYRDGRNEYLLNSQHVRLKDINELLAKSGLSERTYTILGQGLVDASLALKADDRRRLFEEAAGIGLYRTRREEALRRLEDTQRNLDRVLDILAELEPRLRSLERQAARAQEYTQLQADLRVLLLDWYGFHWHLAQRELKDASELSRSQGIKMEQIRQSYQNVRQNFSTFRERLNGLRARLNSWHRQSAQLHESREAASQKLGMLDERQRSLLDNQQATTSEQARLQEENRVAEERLQESRNELNSLQAEFNEAAAQMEAAQAALTNRQKERNQLEKEILAARQKLDELAGQRSGHQGRLNELAARAEGQKQKLSAISEATGSLEAELEKTAGELQEAERIRKKAEAEVQKAEAGLQLEQRRLADYEKQIKDTRAAIAAKQANQARLTAQMEVLDQAEQSLAGYAEGARTLLEAARNSKLSGARGALSSVLDVPAELETAIAAALGEYTDAVLLTSGMNAEQALELLDSGQTGRASLLPLDWLNPERALPSREDSDCLGIAADLVGAPMELRPAVDLLLGQVMVVRDRKAARKVLAGRNTNTRAVTLGGEVFFASGQVLAGKQAKATGLGRPRQRRELQEALKVVERESTSLDTELRKLTGRAEAAQEEVVARQEALSKVRASLEAARAGEQQTSTRQATLEKQLEWQKKQEKILGSEIQQVEIESKRISETISQTARAGADAQDTLKNKQAAQNALPLEELQEETRAWSTRAAVSTRALNDARRGATEREETVKRLQKQAADMALRLSEIEKALQELDTERENLRTQTSGVNGQLEELRRLIEPAEKELEEIASEEGNLQKQETESQMALARVERTYNQVQLDLGRKQEMLENLRQKIEDDFGLVEFEYDTEVEGPVPLPFDGMVEQLPTVTELSPDLEENMTRLRAQLRRMGAINPEAQQEYKAVKERHAFMTEQVEDLRKAEADLREIINELDELTRIEFRKTFEAVAEQFHTIFRQLFGGGAARLVLTDPDNLTETGIDIEAKLPGRREQGLSLLSGGERSLTAIALVFSLLKVSPTPVCVMDEVDAMLDEANVGRFRDLLLELSKQTQFIIITHNRNTVQAAEVIYGVTMGRDSASQIISLKLDEVSEDYLK
jgi:chromosome segregation protein